MIEVRGVRNKREREILLSARLLTWALVMPYVCSMPSQVSPETTSCHLVHWASVLGCSGDGAVGVADVVVVVVVLLLLLVYGAPMQMYSLAQRLAQFEPM